jgi:ribonucleoside-diphosphate reductase alpha chain
MEKGIVTTVKKRNGKIVRFDVDKIRIAIKKAFLANNMSNDLASYTLTQGVINIIQTKFNEKNIPTVEHVQDAVEIVLISQGYTEIARRYMLYREKHKVLREAKTLAQIQSAQLYVLRNGKEEVFEQERIQRKLDKIAVGLDKVAVYGIVDEICKTVYNKIPVKEIDQLILNCVKAKIEEHYNYSLFSSRLVLNALYEGVLQTPLYGENLESMYQYKFVSYIDKGVELGLLDPKLKEYNLEKISQALISSRDLLFHYLGVQTFEDRYLLKTRVKPQRVFELPQWLWMRVAMGLAINEENKEERAIEFYNILSQFYLVSSTPTLFNSGTTHSQMSSCYINVLEDSMEGIFKNYADCAQLSKWAGGIGTDWTPVRSKGTKIRGTNGESQGIIPFIKIYNDVALAVNQGGKRKGAMAAYLEVWHADLYEFLELRKNTGDERRRAHDIHTSLFICDTFMKRVKSRGKWTLFSPDKVKDLHNLYGRAFEERYEWYENQNIDGAIQLDAVQLWRKILTMLYETGHPWITFKCPINIRSPQDHVGVIHSSNLCTEITLNTSKEETAVCNLASINLSKMIKDKQLNQALIKETITTGMRMLDNVIDNNFYPIPEAKKSNLRHRPVGLGVMGYQDALYQLGIDFDSAENLDFADQSMEMISYYAILSSSLLAKEKGTYSSYKGSKWERGIFPLDTIDLLEKERGEKVHVNRDSKLDWEVVKQHVREHGMRNSNTMAIAPTATIANITGVVPCVEPIYKNIYMKENLSGNFIVINRYLIDALEERGLWDKNILNKIKLNDGSLAEVEEIPQDLKRRFKEVFEIDARWVVESAARRGKWIDQAASTNIFLSTSSGKVVSDVYMRAWELGMKTTYYLRTLAATQVTKTTQVETQPQSVEGKVKIGASTVIPVSKKIGSVPKDPSYDTCEACE